MTTEKVSADAPISVRISRDEQSSGALTPENLLTAVVALAEDGLVVLENAVDKEHIDILHERILEDVDEIVKMETTHFNSPANINQTPPLLPEMMFEDIYANPFVIDVLEAVLGPKPSLRYLNGNTALVSEERQFVHADLAWRHPHVTFALTVSIYTVDTCVENGATELWLGSHRDTSWADHPTDTMLHTIKPDVVEKRRAVRAPLQPSIPKGSIVIRDPRLWHAGMPNRTKDARPCIMLSFSPAWINNKTRIKLPRTIEKVIVSYSEKIEIPAEYVDEYDYRSQDFTYDLSPWAGRSAEEKDTLKEQWVQRWGTRF